MNIKCQHLLYQWPTYYLIMFYQWLRLGIFLVTNFERNTIIQLETTVSLGSEHNRHWKFKITCHIITILPLVPKDLENVARIHYFKVTHQSSRSKSSDGTLLGHSTSPTWLTQNQMLQTLSYVICWKLKTSQKWIVFYNFSAAILDVGGPLGVLSLRI